MMVDKANLGLARNCPIQSDIFVACPAMQDPQQLPAFQYNFKDCHYLLEGLSSRVCLIYDNLQEPQVTRRSTTKHLGRCQVEAFGQSRGGALQVLDKMAPKTSEISCLTCEHCVNPYKAATESSRRRIDYVGMPLLLSLRLGAQSHVLHSARLPAAGLIYRCRTGVGQ